MASILFLKVFTSNVGSLSSFIFWCFFPEFATIMIVKFGFMGKRCVCRSYLIPFISGMYYHLTKFGGSYFKKNHFPNQGTGKIQLEFSLAVRLGTLVSLGRVWFCLRSLGVDQVC